MSDELIVIDDTFANDECSHEHTTTTNGGRKLEYKCPH